jgi:hypothetical protein
MEKYSFSDLYKKYNLDIGRGGTTATKITCLKRKGIIIKEIP